MERCPFCGGDKLFTDHSRDPSRYSCALVACPGYDIDATAEQWNTRAPPPLAPCEPSAEPTIEACVQTFIDGMNECCPEGYGPVKHVGDWERAGIAAVRALCLRAREAPTERAP
jgi:hypothetical protein